MRSPFYENLLKKEGLEHETGWIYFEKIPLNEIDLVKSLRNQARLTEPVVEDLVAAYAAAKKSGDDFPALVLYQPTPRTKYRIIDGNQRAEAFSRAGVKMVDAYVILSADPMVIDRLTWTWNNKTNGLRITQEEALAHAISYVRKYGLSTREAAKEWGVHHLKIQKQIRVEDTRSLLHKHGVDTSKTVDSLIDRFTTLHIHGEDVVAKVGALVVENGLSQDDVDRLNRDIRAAKTSEDKLCVIANLAASEEVKARRAETKGGKLAMPKKTNREKYLRWLSDGVRLFSGCPDDAALRPLAHERADAREEAREVVSRVTHLHGLGAVPAEKGVG